ncbi:hypothetical protein [Mycobacterium sp.]|uniref:hypothetical protein n=1 Tax=Mycobacterium sp. TaxID=1785 RepID=UPI003F9D0BC2
MCEAYRDFWRGGGHPAALNLGDCYSYALADVTGELLLHGGVSSTTPTSVPPIGSEPSLVHPLR